ncbi:hypothetical protein [uncultured Dysgonomonas sp.]|uniref:Uncharacterized protein n=1 Tax=uncultured Dysgonomonas sp. TaxID=206096 RepID=A0A212IZ65_9BACT|nr:hypothetical protein [uncultured Dysgonomonas sp.]SBV92470.1 conserved exported hypothetical protein [uncultured Dysgonomonas sp.]
MKRYLSILFLLITVFFNSCAIYENIYFQEDGSVKYDMSIDASEILSMTSDMNMSMADKIPTDSVIYLSDILKDTLNITDDMKKDMINIAPLAIRMQNDVANKKLGISLSGSFKDAEAFNKAFVSMKKLEDKIKSKDEEAQSLSQNLSIDKLYNLTSLTWDGSVMTRTVETNKDIEPENGVDNLLKGNNPFGMFLEKGKMVVKYHFPKKIEKISNPNAVFSQDGKTAIIEYSGSVFTKPTTEFSVEITTEK